MRHQLAGRKLNRTTAHRKALFANQAVSLLEHERIKTTLPKAKELRRVVEKLITLGKKGDLNARRQVLKTIQDQVIVKKLFDKIAPKFSTRPGGYTRILKLGYNTNRLDRAPMAIIELVEFIERTEAVKQDKGEKGKKGKGKNDEQA